MSPGPKLLDQAVYRRLLAQRFFDTGGGEFPFDGGLAAYEKTLAGRRFLLDRPKFVPPAAVDGFRVAEKPLVESLDENDIVLGESRGLIEKLLQFAHGSASKVLVPSSLGRCASRMGALSTNLEAAYPRTSCFESCSGLEAGMGGISLRESEPACSGAGRFRLGSRYVSGTAIFKVCVGD